MKLLLAVWILLGVAEVYAQPASWEAREAQISKSSNDTTKVNDWNQLAAEIQFEDPTHAISLLQQSIILAKQLNYAYGLSVAYTQRATLLFYEAKLDSAKRLFDLAHALALQSNSPKAQRQLALVTQRYAGLYQQNQKYDSAVVAYQSAAEQFSKLGDNTTVIVCYYNLSAIYTILGDTANALQYARQTNQIALQTGDSTYILRSYIALADAYVGAKKFDVVKGISEKGLRLAHAQKGLFPIGKFHLLLGTYFDYKAHYDSALKHFNIALQAFSTINLGYETSLAMQHIGHTHLQKGDTKQAIEILQQALTKCRTLKLDQVLRLVLADLVLAQEQAGNIKESLQYLKEYVVVNDSITQRTNRKVVYDLEVKYQTQKKEAQLQIQKNELSRKNFINLLLAGSVVSILIILFFMYYSFKQRRLLQEKRISNLEAEKQLLASEAVIKGQEEERGRLAKDLHDGLGGLLSGVKFSFANMKSNVVLDAANAQAFERSLDMLDNSIAELRRVAHNMMPEVLVKFGLHEALKSYCDSIQQSGIFKVDFQSLGNEVRLASNTEIILYRIVQELLNNASKYAKASTVLVQLAFHENEIGITVEDNGIGFDVAKTNYSTGAGWSNIRARVDYLKGTLDVTSGTNGTSVHIHIPQ
ncbi:MAG: tetratricopeptide repeat protein [Cyclobacteriaceae bacterium]|nr:tetratricopeptide repeat protein [Cyclobacteriaceae bacterium]